MERNVGTYVGGEFIVWIGSCGSAEWTLGSPILTLCDFSVWGMIKYRVYGKKPVYVMQIKECNSFDANGAFCRWMLRRYEVSIEHGGQQFEICGNKMPTRCNSGFIADLIACSTCFGHHYTHHQELKSIIQ